MQKVAQENDWQQELAFVISKLKEIGRVGLVRRGSTDKRRNG